MSSSFEVSASKSKTSRRYAFTCYDVQNFNPEEAAVLAKAKFLIFQEETCPKTGRPHIQGFIHLNSPQKYASVNKLMGATCSFFVAKGSDEENETYCSKEESRVQGGKRARWGQPVAGQGARTDLASVLEVLNTPGMTLNKLANEHPHILLKHARGVEAVLSNKSTKIRNEPPRVTIFWGPTGMGKTKRSIEEATLKAEELGVNVFVMGGKLSDRFAWQGYEHGDCVIIDEFTPSQADITRVLRLLDRYPLRVGKLLTSVTWSQVTKSRG